MGANQLICRPKVCRWLSHVATESEGDATYLPTCLSSGEIPAQTNIRTQHWLLAQDGKRLGSRRPAPIVECASCQEEVAFFRFLFASRAEAKLHGFSRRRAPIGGAKVSCRSVASHFPVPNLRASRARPHDRSHRDDSAGGEWGFDQPLPRVPAMAASSTFVCLL
jgi:hypothetical protein